jgi:hypothetical protein
MSDTSSGGGRSGAKKPTKKNGRRKDVLASEGVLANLPRTRPQRSSARRDAARRTIPETQTKPVPQTKRVAKKAPTAQAKAAPKTRPVNAVQADVIPSTKPLRKQTTAKKRPSQTKSATKAVQDPAPRQGFEAESDHLSGPVQPPGGVDLFTSAAELAGELTKSGLSAGGRLLKDALARLPLN